MLGLILAFGAAAGLLVAVPMCVMVASSDPGSAGHSQLVGYLTMIVALSLIFVAVKRYRDRSLGGVIRFGTALGIGLGISAVAGVIYVIGWEITLAVTDFAFVDAYASATDMASFRLQYLNPWFRMPLTFTEVFPVGVVISLISAALLRRRPPM